MTLRDITDVEWQAILRARREILKALWDGTARVVTLTVGLPHPYAELSRSSWLTGLPVCRWCGKDQVDAIHAEELIKSQEPAHEFEPNLTNNGPLVCDRCGESYSDRARHVDVPADPRLPRLQPRQMPNIAQCKHPQQGSRGHCSIEGCDNYVGREWPGHDYEPCECPAHRISVDPDWCRVCGGKRSAQPHRPGDDR